MRARGGSAATIPQRNVSTYVFRARVLYDALRRLGHPPGREVYLTDLVELLFKGGQPARVQAYEVKPAEAIMAFNTAKELAAVRDAFRLLKGFGRLQQPGLSADGGLQAQFAVAQLRGDASLGGAFEVAFHDEVGLVDFLDRVRFLAHRHGQRADAHRAAAELYDEGFQDALVHFVQAVLVDLQHGQRFVGDVCRDAAIVPHLGVIPHAPQEVVGDARRAPAAAGDFHARRVFVDLDIQQAGGAEDDCLELLGVVVVQPLANAGNGSAAER